MASIKTPYGYGRQPIIHFQEISAGRSPAISDEKVAIWLPAIQLSQLQSEYHVVLAGTIVARDATTGTLVPANGGAQQDVTYTAADVNYSYDVSSPTSLVTVAKTVSNALAANYPMGWCYYHWFSRSAQLRNINYDLQPNIATLNDYLVQVPLLWDEQYTGAATALQDGRLVRPLGSSTWSKNGAPVYWLNGTHSVDQICGRVLKLHTIAEIDNLSKVRTMQGAGLSGDGTSGIEHWLSALREDGVTAVSKAAYIAIDFM